MKNQLYFHILHFIPPPIVKWCKLYELLLSFNNIDLNYWSARVIISAKTIKKVYYMPEKLAFMPYNMINDLGL